MSPQMGDMLVNDVVPRLRAAASSVPWVGHEDREELVADMTANAASMIDSAERAGKNFTAGNIAYYTTRAARSGRRSTGSSHSDVLSPGTQLDGRVRLDQLDGAPDAPPTGRQGAKVDSDDGSDGLHELVWSSIADSTPTDPSEEAARNLDWEAFLAVSPPRHRTAIMVLAGGGTMREAGRLCGIGDSAARNLRLRIGEALVEFFGPEILGRILAGIRPTWEPDLRASRERHACGSVQGRSQHSRSDTATSQPSDE